MVVDVLCTALAAAAWGTPLRAKEMRTLLLRTFVTQFVEVPPAFTELPQVLTFLQRQCAEAKRCVLRSNVRYSASVAAWLDKTHTTLSEEPRKLLKRLEKFVRYHVEKDHRMASRNVFALLAAEVLDRRIRIRDAASGEMQWYYPNVVYVDPRSSEGGITLDELVTNSKNYYDRSVPLIALRWDGKTYTWEEEEEEKEKDTSEKSIYMLQRYVVVTKFVKDWSNEYVAHFEALDADVYRCNVGQYWSAEWRTEHVVHCNVFPDHTRCTDLQLMGRSLYVFVDGALRVQTSETHEWPYFAVRPGTRVLHLVLTLDERSARAKLAQYESGHAKDESEH